LNKIWAFLGFKGDLPKINDNVDVAWIANEIMPCVLKKEPQQMLCLKLTVIMSFCILNRELI